jgi:S-adenosylmethionine:tRNA ribosyltransferase-isomerase
MNTAELDFALPEDLIAQHPAEPRDAARLLVVDRESGSIRDDVFQNIGQYFTAGDRLVLNDTRVIRARLRARKPTGGRVEIFLLRELTPGAWEALVRPSAKVQPGTRIQFDGGECTVAEVLPGGKRRVVFDTADVIALLNRTGVVPLPPYIARDEPEASDLTQYQTVYAARDGAVAAPTAGLHYTGNVFNSLDRAGVTRSFITLHVGYGTFKPVQAERLSEHTVDPEDFDASAETVRELNATRAHGNRIVAVGTTAARVLETIHDGGRFHAQSGQTSKYIYPPYTFRSVDALQTNFHLPKSSLLALVYAFGGAGLMREAYAHAVREGYRFYSYGDTMLIL